MALTTVKLGMLTKDDYTSYVALDPAEFVPVAPDTAPLLALRTFLTGRTLNNKYIDGLLTDTQKAYLYAKLVAASTTIDLVLMP